MSPPLPDRITVNPDPMEAGKSALICYDFTGLTSTSVQLSFTWDPAGSPSSLELTSDDPCQTITVPEANTVLIVDESAQSADYGGAVA
jgi:hypothetical protein